EWSSLRLELDDAQVLKHPCERDTMGTRASLALGGLRNGRRASVIDLLAPTVSGAEHLAGRPRACGLREPTGDDSRGSSATSRRPSQRGSRPRSRTPISATGMARARWRTSPS